MPKKKRFIILFSIIVVLIFSTAITCNLCGTPITIEDQQEETGGQTTDNSPQENDTSTDAPPTDDVTRGVDGDPPGDDTDPVDDDDMSDEGNSPPDIAAIFFGDEEMTDFLRVETLPERYEEADHNITVIAEDPDGDEMNFNIVATQGEVADITRLAVDSVSFNWISPPNTEDSETPLDVDIAVTVSDPHGAEDSFTINIALLPVAEEEFDFGGAVSIEADPSLSGYIIKDTEVGYEMIIVGDISLNKQTKGYLSFDLSYFDRYDGVDIIDAVFIIDHINKRGEPADFSTIVDFKAFDYGTEINMADFAVGGNRIFSVELPTFVSPFEISSESLLNEMQNAIDSGKERFQIKVGLNGATDSEDDYDFYLFYPEVVFLDIAYNPR